MLRPIDASGEKFAEIPRWCHRLPVDEREGFGLPSTLKTMGTAPWRILLAMIELN